MKFRVRVDDVDEATQKLLLEHVANVGVSHVLVRHFFDDGHNPHYHYYIDIPDVKSCQSYRYKFKTRVAFHFKMKSSDYSITQCSDDRVDEYIQYLFNTKHGNKWQLLSSTLDTSLHQQRAGLVAEAYEAQSSKAKDSVSQWQLSVELRDAIDQLDSTMYESHVTIVDMAISLHNKYKKPFCEFSLRKVILTAIGQSKWREEIVHKLAQKIFWQ